MQNQKESLRDRQIRANKILKVLLQNPRPATGLTNWDPKKPWQFLFCVILSAQANDDQVNKATKKLFKTFSTLTAFVAEGDYSATAKIRQIQEAIKSIGIYKNKSRYLYATAKKLLRKHKGKVPRPLNTLIILPGVGRKTANVYQGVIFGRSEGVAVDTHVARVSKRLALTKPPKQKNRTLTPEKTERQLMRVFAKRKYHLVNPAFFWHGREICTSRKPKCQKCAIRGLCPLA